MNPLEHMSSEQIQEGFHVSVIGIGAMGGGMGRALLESDRTVQVIGYDHSMGLVDVFYEDAFQKHKAPAAKPNCLRDAVHEKTQFVLLALQNEPQCEKVCFNDDGGNLFALLQPRTCVILTSTVTSEWARSAYRRFQSKQILFVDSPISGGPVRARSGELTIMASGESESLTRAQPILDILAKEVHIIPGGAGMGSTVKMVHQLLAGVHIVAAAEALALAAKAGLDVNQLYKIVNGAAGASWMFQDRGQRMLSPSAQIDVKSQLQIFVKDLDIVHAEAKRLQAPVPLASTALQQFISGLSLGLAKKDDSQVVQVYEKITGVPVAENQKSAQIEGDSVGEFWRMPDGTLEQIVEVGNEPRHQVVYTNEYVRAIVVHFPPGETTLAHRHSEDSLYFFLVEGGLDVINHVKGAAPCCDSMEFGEVRFGTHKTDKPLVHKITNMTNKEMLCVDAELLKQPPITAAIPLVAEKHELIKVRDKCRVYKLTLEPGDSVCVSYPFFYLSVVLEGGEIEKRLGGRVSWVERSNRGDVAWKEPTMDWTKRNVGRTRFVEFIAEWR